MMEKWLSAVVHVKSRSFFRRFQEIGRNERNSKESKNLGPSEKIAWLIITNEQALGILPTLHGEAWVVSIYIPDISFIFVIPRQEDFRGHPGLSTHRRMHGRAAYGLYYTHTWPSHNNNKKQQQQ